jgi:cytochrome c oxidase assembly factor CtaG
MLTILLVFGVALLVYLTFAGAIRASRNDDRDWAVGIFFAWLCGVGWLVGAIYLATHRKSRVGAGN